jgi:hypothetical protein
MSNRRVIVKFSFIAAMFVLVSCHNDVPELPNPIEVSKYKYCQYKDKNDSLQRKSTYQISEKNCETINGKLFCDADCSKEPPCEWEQ